MAFCPLAPSPCLLPAPHERLPCDSLLLWGVNFWRAG